MCHEDLFLLLAVHSDPLDVCLRRADRRDTELLWLRLEETGAVDQSSLLPHNTGSDRKHPALKQFLKGGEAECYKKVSVVYIRSKRGAVLKISDNGVLLKEINLSEYRTIEQLHVLMKENGFEPRDEAEISRIRSKARRKLAEENEMYHKRVEYHRWKRIYVQEFRDLIHESPEDKCSVTKSADMFDRNYDRINMAVVEGSYPKQAVYASERLEAAVSFLQA